MTLRYSVAFNMFVDIIQLMIGKALIKIQMMSKQSETFAWKTWQASKIKEFQWTLPQICYI